MVDIWTFSNLLKPRTHSQHDPDTTERTKPSTIVCLFCLSPPIQPFPVLFSLLSLSQVSTWPLHFVPCHFSLHHIVLIARVSVGNFYLFFYTCKWLRSFSSNVAILSFPFPLQPDFWKNRGWFTLIASISSPPTYSLILLFEFCLHYWKCSPDGHHRTLSTKSSDRLCVLFHLVHQAAFPDFV